jgi:hypothetical protein
VLLGVPTVVVGTVDPPPTVELGVEELLDVVLADVAPMKWPVLPGGTVSCEAIGVVVAVEPLPQAATPTAAAIPAASAPSIRDGPTIRELSVRADSSACRNSGSR